MKRSSSLGSRGSINSGATNKMTLRSQSIAPHSTQGLPHHHLKRQPSVTSVASTHYQELVEEEDNWGHWWRTVVDASASVLLGFRNPSEELDEGSADHARFRSRVEAYFHWNLVALVLMAVLCSLLAWRGLLRAAITAAICVACLVCAVLVLQACMRFRLLNIESGVWWLVQASRMAFVWTPIAMYVAAGGVFFSTDIFLWNCAGPLASILILSQKLTRVDVLLLVLRNFEIALVCLLEFWGVFGSAEGMMPEQTTFAYDDWGSEGRLTMQIFTHACLPVAVALAFRRSVKEFLRWREVHLGVSEQLHDQREFTEQLLHSAVPPRRAQLLRDTDPSEWHKQSSDDYEECTIVQMDITGFTALSSDLRADELLDLVNAIFTSIDKAAELIGKVWKVETIGDCYQVIIGGPYPCDDHVQRGLELGISILHILRSVSDRVSVPVMGRIGLHTGRVTAAVVGTVLPRYLVYGPDVIITRHMEESGTKNTIQLTEASRQHLPADKWHLEGPHPYSTNGAVGQSYTACFGPQNFEVLLAAARLRNPILEEFLSHFGVQPLLHMPSPGNSPLAAVVRSSCLGSPPQATFSRVASSASHVSESWRARSGESSDVSRKVSLESPTPSASACHEDSNVQLHGATYDKDEAILKSKLLLSDCGAVTSSNAPADQSSSISALRSDSAEQISGNESWMAIKTNGIRNRFERDVLVRQVAGDGQDRAGPDRARPRSNSDSTAEDRGRSPAVTFGSLLRTTPKSLGQVVSEGMEHADLCMHLPGSVNASAPDEGADGTACNPTPLPDPFSDALFGMEVTPAFKLGSPRSGDAVVRRQGSAPLVNEGLSLQGLKSPEQDHRRAQQGDSQTSEDLQRTPSANTFENEKNGSRTISDGGAGNSSTKAKAGAAAIHGRPTGLTVTDLRKMKASAERGTLRDEDLQFLRVKSSLLAGAASNRLVENGASSMRLSRFRELRHELEQFTRTETSGGAAVAGRVGRDEPLSSEAERRSALQGSEKVIVATPGSHRGTGTGVGIGGEATVGGMSFTWRGKPRVGLAGGPGRIPDAGEGKSLDVAGTAASGNSWVQSSGLERSLGPLAPNGTGAPSRSGSALQPVLSCRSNPQPAEPCQCRPTSCPTSASSERASSLHMGNAPAQLPSPSRKQQPLAERKSAMRDSQRDLLCAVGSTLPGSRATLVATAGSSQRLDLAEGLRAGTEVSAHAAGTASPAAFSSFRGSFLFRGSFPQTAEAAARTSSDTTGPLRARPRKIGGGTELTPVISGEDVENERPDVMGKENRDMRQQDLRVVILRSLLLCVGLGGTLLAVLWHREFLHELQEFGGPPWELQYTLMVAGGISWVVYSLVSLALGLLAIRDPWLLAPHWIQSLAQLVLFAGPVLFSMTYCGYIAKRLVVWSFVAILLQCCSYYFSNLRFLTVIGLYTAFVAVANHAAASHVVTDEVLPTMFMQDNLSLLAISLLHHIVPATALFLAVALSVKQLLGQWEQNVSSLDALEAELILETTVLHALVPSDIAARLVQGREACIADTSTNAAVLFVYLLDSDELIARFGVRSVVDWINSVFKCFDGVIQPEGGSSSGCTKIETFSQFYLAVAWDQHPELLPEDYRTYPDPAVAAIRACVLMAQSVAHVRRPDGKPTEVCPAPVLTDCHGCPLVSIGSEIFGHLSALCPLISSAWGSTRGRCARVLLGIHRRRVSRSLATL